jgi:hypothetical protein
MAVMETDRVAERARQRALVRRGYDAISLAYRSDDGNAAASSAQDVSRYVGWVAELAGLLRPGARVVDLGCGAGIPAVIGVRRGTPRLPLAAWTRGMSAGPPGQDGPAGKS